MVVVAQDYCCGFHWKTGFTIFIVIDVISSILALAVYGVVLDIYQHPKDLARVFKADLPIPTSDQSAGQTIDTVNEIQRLIRERIMANCGEVVNLDRFYILQKLVLSMSLYAVGTIGFFITAIILMAALCKKDKCSILGIVIFLEILFICPTLIGGYVYLSTALCPINYNLAGVPRRQVCIVMTTGVLLYKIHEIYTIFRFIIQDTRLLKGPSLSQEAIISKRRSYAMMGYTGQLPRKSYPLLPDLNPSDSDESNPSASATSTIQPNSKDLIQAKVKVNPVTRKSYIRLGSFDFRKELDRMADETRLSKEIEMSEKDTLMNIVDASSNMNDASVQQSTVGLMSMASTMATVQPAATSTIQLDPSASTIVPPAIEVESVQNHYGHHKNKKHKPRSSKDNFKRKSRGSMSKKSKRRTVTEEPWSINAPKPPRKSESKSRGSTIKKSKRNTVTEKPSSINAPKPPRKSEPKSKDK